MIRYLLHTAHSSASAGDNHKDNVDNNKDEATDTANHRKFLCFLRSIYSAVVVTLCIKRTNLYRINDRSHT